MTTDIATQTSTALADLLYSSRWNRRFTTSSTIVETDNYTVVDGAYRRLLLVTRAESNGTKEVPDGIVGTIHNAFMITSESGHCLVSDFADMPAGAKTVKAWGALVNPEPVHNRYYREFMITGEEGKLLRWSETALRFDIISGPGNEPWPYPNDSTIRTAVPIWVEVEGVETTTPEPEPIVQVPLNHDFFGKAELDGDGKPVVVDQGTADRGTVLLAADPDNASEVVMVLIEDGLTTVGRYYSAERFTPSNHTFTPGRDTKWSRLALVKESPDADWDAVQVSVNTKRWAAAEKFEALNEALNENANERDCCPEYEGIVEPLGFEPRNQDKDWSVDVSVRATISMNSVPGEIDEKVSEYMGGDIALCIEGGVEFTATFDITISVDDQSSEDSVRDYIDSEMVENEIDAMLSNGAVSELHSWNITDVNERG